jgi:short-subunit dehydrogenase
MAKPLPAAEFKQRYGEWAIVTGASSGIGEAFAHGLAARGVRPLLVARRTDELSRVAADIAAQYGIEAGIFPADLADPGFVRGLEAACAGRDIGLVISNAAYNPAGGFLDLPLADKLRMLDVNCRAGLLLAEAFFPRLAARPQSGFMLVGSVEGFAGSPYSAVYSATKAFTLSLGEALWGEFRDQGVDVLVLIPGATDTPLLASRQMKVRGAMPARDVAEIGLDNLPFGPSIIAGSTNRWMFRILRRLPRKWSVQMVAKATKPMIEKLKRPTSV